MLLSLEDGDEIVKLEEAVAQICKAMLAFPLNLPRTRFCKGLQVIYLQKALAILSLSCMVLTNCSNETSMEFKARQRITGTLDRVISDRRRGKGANQEDFLHHLMACPAGLNRLTDAEIKDNILTMIIAGHFHYVYFIIYLIIQRNNIHHLIEERKKLNLTGQDTTASAITWMVKYLSENQEVLEILKV